MRHRGFFVGGGGALISDIGPRLPRMRAARAILTAGCALACLVVAAAWVRGVFRSDFVGYGFAGPAGTTRVAALTHGKGGVAFSVIDVPADPLLHGALWHDEPPSYAEDVGRLPTPWQAAGFMFVPQMPGATERGWAVAVPLWFLLLLFGARPAWQLLRGRRERSRRSRLGLCARCGYDLRATPGRCPECGITPRVPPDSLS